MAQIKVFWGAPGTGKTHKAVEILTDAIIEGKSISYDTFRRSMAEDAYARLADAIYERSDMGDRELRRTLRYVSTTHGICFRLLGLAPSQVVRFTDFKKFCEENNLHIEAREFHALQKEIVDFDFYETSGGKFLALYCNCVNCLVPYDDYMSLPSYMIPQGSLPFDFPKLARKYDAFKERIGKVDFTDMLRTVYEEQMSPLTSVHICDEFHDKTPLQYELFKIWAENADEVYCCLDFNQRIYSHWGTNLTKIDELRKFPIEILRQSYRLGVKQYIYAKSIIQPQEMPELFCKGDTEVHEINTVHEFIKTLYECGSACLLLGRTKHHLREIANVLNAHGIIFTGDPRFAWKRKEIKLFDALHALYRDELTPEDLKTLLDALSPEAFAHDKLSIEYNLVDYATNMSADEIFSQHFLTRFRFSPKSISSFILPSFLKDEKSVQKVLNASFEQPEHKDPYMPRKFPRLLTIHASKGLEEDYVFVFDGISRRILKSITSFRDEYENEQRVWYVAVTRARNKVFIVRNFFSAPLRLRSFLPPLKEALYGLKGVELL